MTIDAKEKDKKKILIEGNIRVYIFMTLKQAKVSLVRHTKNSLKISNCTLKLSVHQKLLLRELINMTYLKKLFTINILDKGFILRI